MSRWLPWLAELQPELFVEIDPVLAARARHRGRRLDDGQSAARAEIAARAVVTDRMRPLQVDGRVIHQVALPWHWGYAGPDPGDAANDLIALVGRPQRVDPGVQGVRLRRAGRAARRERHRRAWRRARVAARRRPRQDHPAEDPPQT